jgi:hypothetical protein
MTKIDERAEARMALQKILWELDIDPEKININSMGLFEDYIMQARATLPTAGNNHIEDILALVAKQAEDEGLWFDAKYASEAYLQKALRKLHAVIESSPPEPTAEAPEYEVVRIMADGMEPTYSDTYSSRELIEKALRALPDNGYKVVRK